LQATNVSPSEPPALVQAEALVSAQATHPVSAAFTPNPSSHSPASHLVASTSHFLQLAGQASHLAVSTLCLGSQVSTFEVPELSLHPITPVVGVILAPQAPSHKVPVPSYFKFLHLVQTVAEVHSKQSVGQPVHVPSVARKNPCLHLAVLHLAKSVGSH
jgi:hypothetical protein